MNRSRNFCFTINNPLEHGETREWLEGKLKEGGAIYYVFQLEKGKEETPHWQGFVRFKCQKKLSAIKKLLPRAHIEEANGSAEQNRNYVTKTEGRIEEPVEFGEKPIQGKRNDLDAVKKRLDEGASMRDIAQEHFGSFVKYYKGIERASNLLNPKEPRNFLTELWIFWGDTGTGKSRTAFELGRQSGYYEPAYGNGGLWWDGYEGQHTIIFDEFKGGVQLGVLKRLADRNRYVVDRKGLEPMQFTSKRIIITSNKSPDDWYDRSKFNEAELEALQRRITFNVFFGKNGIVTLFDDRQEKIDLPSFSN